MAQIFTATEIIEGIDFPQLKGQKLSLLATIDELEREGKTTQAKDLTGILTLIDHIQDHAVDVLGKDEKEVFNLTPEEDEEV